MITHLLPFDGKSYWSITIKQHLDALLQILDSWYSMHFWSGIYEYWPIGSRTSSSQEQFTNKLLVSIRHEVFEGLSGIAISLLGFKFKNLNTCTQKFGFSPMDMWLYHKLDIWLFLTVISLPSTRLVMLDLRISVIPGPLNPPLCEIRQVRDESYWYYLPQSGMRFLGRKCAGLALLLLRIGLLRLYSRQVWSTSTKYIGCNRYYPTHSIWARDRANDYVSFESYCVSHFSTKAWGIEVQICNKWNFETARRCQFWSLINKNKGGYYNEIRGPRRSDRTLCLSQSLKLVMYWTEMWDCDFAKCNKCKFCLDHRCKLCMMADLDIYRDQWSFISHTDSGYSISWALSVWLGILGDCYADIVCLLCTQGVHYD